MKGRRLIDNNPKTPRLAQQMQSQLQNLEESYVNLQATAEQIRVSCLSLIYRIIVELSPLLAKTLSYSEIKGH